jgi:hypothetical protein
VRKCTFACFLAVQVTWMIFAFVAREWRRGVWAILETHIMMSLLISRDILLLMLHLISFMDLTIAHMVLVHERIALCLDTLVMAHVLILVIVPHVGIVFLLEVLIHTLSRAALMVHAFPAMFHVPLAQIVRCKGL